MCPAADYMNFGTELMAGLCTALAKKVKWNSIITLATMETIITKAITETIGTMTALIAKKLYFETSRI